MPLCICTFRSWRPKLLERARLIFNNVLLENQPADTCFSIIGDAALPERAAYFATVLKDSMWAGGKVWH